MIIPNYFALRVSLYIAVKRINLDIIFIMLDKNSGQDAANIEVRGDLQF